MGKGLGSHSASHSPLTETSVATQALLPRAVTPSPDQSPTSTALVKASGFAPLSPTPLRPTPGAYKGTGHVGRRYALRHVETAKTARTVVQVEMGSQRISPPAEAGKAEAGKSDWRFSAGYRVHSELRRDPVLMHRGRILGAHWEPNWEPNCTASGAQSRTRMDDSTRI